MSQKGPAPISVEAVQRLKRDVARLERDLRAARQLVGAGAKGTAKIEERAAAAAEEVEEARVRLGRLYSREVEESRRRADRLHGVLDLVKELSADRPPEILFERIAESVASQLGYRRVLVRVREPGPNGVDVFRSHGFTGYDPRTRDALAAFDLSADTFEPWLAEEYQLGAARYVPHDRGLDAAVVKGEIADLGDRASGEWHARDVLLLPLYGRTGTLLACISLDDPVSRLAPSRDIVDLLELYGRLAMACLENAQFHDRARIQGKEVTRARRRARRARALVTSVLGRAEGELGAALEALRDPKPGERPANQKSASASPAAARLERALEWISQVRRRELSTADPTGTAPRGEEPDPDPTGSEPGEGSVGPQGGGSGVPHR